MLTWSGAIQWKWFDINFTTFSWASNCQCINVDWDSHWLYTIARTNADQNIPGQIALLAHTLTRLYDYGAYSANPEQDYPSWCPVPRGVKFSAGEILKYKLRIFLPRWQMLTLHYNDVIMGTMASQITSLVIIYLTVYSGADQRKHQSSRSLSLVRGIHRWPVNSPHKWQVTRKTFPFDDVIMLRISILSVSFHSQQLRKSMMTQDIDTFSAQLARC